MFVLTSKLRRCVISSECRFFPKLNTYLFWGSDEITNGMISLKKFGSRQTVYEYWKQGETFAQVESFRKWNGFLNDPIGAAFQTNIWVGMEHYLEGTSPIYR